jgi:hypothetical protein
MNLTEAYKQIYYTEQSLYEDLFAFLLEFAFDTEIDAEIFAKQLIENNLISDFLSELAEEWEVDISSCLLEANLLGGARAAINALSRAGRSKAGLQAGTALGKKPESIVRGAAASTSIRSARAARTAAPVQKPGKYAAMQFKKRIDTSLNRPALPPARSAAPAPAAPKRTPADAGMPFRATGAGGDARTQRLATQAAPGSGLNPREVRAQANRMTGGADALNKARRAMAGAAAAGLAASAAAPVVQDKAKKSNPESSINKYNTMDSDGKIRNRLRVGAKIVGTGSVSGDFDAAFKKARTSGSKEFEFRGKKYNTKLKNEDRNDYFDDVLEYLVSEGFVDNNQDALIMMASLDENAIAKIAAGAIKNIIKSGTAKLTKTALPPKMDPALKAVKDSIKQKFGAASLVGTPENKYAAAKQAAELRKNPPPKPKYRDPFPGDVYSRSDFGIRGYRSGD